MAASGAEFAGIALEIEGPEGWYPVVPPAPDAQGKKVVRVTAHLSSRANFNSLAAKTTVVDWDRVLGVLVASPTEQSGYGPATLKLPSHGGRLTTYTAYLEEFADASGLAASKDQWRAILVFAITTSGTA